MALSGNNVDDRERERERTIVRERERDSKYGVISTTGALHLAITE